MSSIYNSLPDEFKVSVDPTALITVWRGDKADRQLSGMMCRLGDVDIAFDQVEQAANDGIEAINTMIDLHTSRYELSPLVSVTTAISRAQGYSTRRGETIYELELPASRLLKDPYHIGSPKKGNDTELFVIGSILPTDIRAIKTNNHDRLASELLFQELVGKHLRTYTVDLTRDMDYQHNPAQLPNPAGMWELIN